YLAAAEAYRQPEHPGLQYFLIQTPHGVYSSYPAGMVLFAVPMVATARLAGADLTNHGVLIRLEKWTAAWLAALSLGLFFLTALRLAEPRPAALTTLFLGGASAMFSTTGQALWQQGGVIFWVQVLLLIEFHARGRPSWRGGVVQGVACGMMLACRLSAGLFIV